MLFYAKLPAILLILTLGAQAEWILSGYRSLNCEDGIYERRGTGIQGCRGSKSYTNFLGSECKLATNPMFV
jgi:hypothetical protein